MQPVAHMTVNQFLQHLRTQGVYRTPSRRRLPGSGLPGWASVAFYARIIHLVAVESRLARRGNYSRWQWAAGSMRSLHIVESVGGQLDISGLQHRAGLRGPVVYIGNHMSMLDTFVLPCLVQPFSHVTFVVKKSLLHYPVFGAIMRAVKPIAVSRRNPREDLKLVMQAGKQNIQAGKSVIIFPQATRSRVFDTRAFNTLGVKLAQRAKAPIVPIALKTDFQDNGTFLKEMGPIDPCLEVHIKFGKPLTVGRNAQDVHQTVTRFIAEAISAWGGCVAGSF